jgi:hypothetical protein
MGYELTDHERVVIKPMLANKRLGLTAGEAHDNRLADKTR